MTASQRKVIRQARRLRMVCTIASASLDVAMFIRRHPKTTFSAAAVLVLAEIAATLVLLNPLASGPAACHTPAAPSGTTISVDAQGNASAPYTGGIGLRCDSGTWVRITGTRIN